MADTGFTGKDITLYFDRNNLPNQNSSQTNYSRMCIFDGSVLKSYRMIYESNRTYLNLFDEPARKIKIFEYVKGAKITGKISPNETAYIWGKIITIQERTFDYMQETNADEKGHFEFSVQYSIDSSYETRLLIGYVPRYCNINLSIDVVENDVIDGTMIKVD